MPLLKPCPCTRVHLGQIGGHDSVLLGEQGGGDLFFLQLNLLGGSTGIGLINSFRSLSKLSPTSLRSIIHFDHSQNCGGRTGGARGSRSKLSSKMQPPFARLLGWDLAQCPTKLHISRGPLSMCMTRFCGYGVASEWPRLATHPRTTAHCQWIRHSQVGSRRWAGRHGWCQ